MPYTEVHTDKGLFLVDTSVVRRIVSDSARLKSQDENAKLKKESDGWLMPTWYHYEVDFPRAKQDAETAVKIHESSGFMRPARRFMSALSRGQQDTCELPSAADLMDFREYLRDLNRQGQGHRESLRRKLQEASSRSMANIDRNVNGWENALRGARFTRDASAAILLTGATVVSGGSLGVAAAVGGGGSILKGVGKWQDTGNVGAAVVDATFSFMLVLIPGKQAGLGNVGNRLLVFTKVKTEFVGNMSVAMLEGKDLGDAAISAAVDTGMGQVAGKMTDGILPESTYKGLFEQGVKGVPIPVNLAVRIVGSGSVNATGSRISSKAQEAILPNQRNKQQAYNKGTIGDRVAIAEPALADLAVLGPDRSGY